jgi:hypothetical protein
MKVHSKSQRSDLWFMRLLIGIFSIAGLGLLAGGIYAGWQTRRFLQTAVEVPGAVIENVWQEGTVFFANGRSAYGSYAYPRIKFQTEDGREISILASKGANPPEYRVNASVTILYDPREPHHASIQSPNSVWFLPILLCGIGAVFCSFGIIAAVSKGVSPGKQVSGLSSIPPNQHTCQSPKRKPIVTGVRRWRNLVSSRMNPPGWSPHFHPSSHVDSQVAGWKGDLSTSSASSHPCRAPGNMKEY